MLYLAFGDGSPNFEQLISRSTHNQLIFFLLPRDYHPLWLPIPRDWLKIVAIGTIAIHQASPISLAATLGVSVDFLSSSYYNVLVHWVIYLWVYLRIALVNIGVANAFRVYTSFRACLLDILNTHFDYLIIHFILGSILIFHYKRGL